MAKKTVVLLVYVSVMALMIGISVGLVGRIRTQQADLAQTADALARTAQQSRVHKAQLDQATDRLAEKEDTIRELTVEVNALRKEEADWLTQKDALQTELIRVKEENARLKRTAQASPAPKQSTSPTKTASSSPKKGRSFSVEASAFTALDGSQSGVTATGVDVRGTATYQGMGIIAVDPSVIPLYSIVEIEGMGTYIALDTGGAIKGNKIDILFGSKTDALAFGRKTLHITVTREGN